MSGETTVDIAARLDEVTELLDEADRGGAQARLLYSFGTNDCLPVAGFTDR